MNPRYEIGSYSKQGHTASWYARGFAIAVVLSALVAVGLDLVCYLVLGQTSAGTWYDKYWMAFFFCCLFIACSFWLLRDRLEDKPELLYLIIVLVVGLFMAWSLSVWILGWDVGIHFKNVLGWADIDGTFELSPAESSYATSSIFTVSGIADEQSLNNLYRLEEWLNANDASIAETQASFSPLGIITNIQYIPPAIVMFFCELLNVPFATRHFLAVVPCVLLYAIVTYLGMKKLKSGKMLYAVIALIPTSMFLVANYGYQYWNQAFFLYGFACLASFMQRRQAVRLREIVFMLVAFILASLPRLSYAPLILLTLLIPKKCFPSDRLSLAYRLGIIITTVLVASIYAIPLLGSGMGEGDWRGGEDVNPAAQLEFILSNPLLFISRLFTFLAPPYTLTPDGVTVVSGFLSPLASIRPLGNYAYLGLISYPYFIALFLLLLFVMFTDKDRNVKYGYAPAIACIGVSLLIIVAITIALYLDFNNVGENAFRGVQARYLLPLIYPTLAFIGSSKWGLNGSVISSSVYNGTALGLSTVILLASWWQAYVMYLY